MSCLPRRDSLASNKSTLHPSESGAPCESTSARASVPARSKVASPMSTEPFSRVRSFQCHFIVA
jgi:hypothetical protein